MLSAPQIVSSKKLLYKLPNLVYLAFITKIWYRHYIYQRHKYTKITRGKVHEANLTQARTLIGRDCAGAATSKGSSDTDQLQSLHCTLLTTRLSCESSNIIVYLKILNAGESALKNLKPS